MSLRACAWLFSFALLSLPASAVWAAEAAGEAPVTAGETSAAPPSAERSPAPLAAVVRGLYVTAGLGGGYAVVDQKVKPDATYPLMPTGARERLGAGSQVSLVVGYDLTKLLAIELLGGVTLVSGGRNDKVRDLGLIYGGAGLHLDLGLSDRVNLTVGAGAAMVRADNGVEKPQTGPAALGSLGVEYYVHVRHFAVGLEASVLAPLSPMRVFCGFGPHLKYTF